MGAFDIIAIVLVSVAFVAAVGVIIYKKIKHKGGCDCGCGHCAYSCKCGRREEK